MSSTRGRDPACPHAAERAEPRLTPRTGVSSERTRGLRETAKPPDPERSRWGTFVTCGVAEFLRTDGKHRQRKKRTGEVFEIKAAP